MSLESVANSAPTSEQSPALILRISPLIGLAVLGLYLVLMLPLPFLAVVSPSPVPPFVLVLVVCLGGVILATPLTQQVRLDSVGMQIFYPAWVPRFWLRGWQLNWPEVQQLKARSTGQGGLVYYLVCQDGQAYLLPTRVAGFAAMVCYIQTQTGIETGSVRPLAQPWMYTAMLLFTVLMGLVDVWVIGTAIAQS